MSMPKPMSPAALWARYEAALRAASAGGLPRGAHADSDPRRTAPLSKGRRTLHRTAKEASR
jgi:hypothetical protein